MLTMEHEELINKCIDDVIKKDNNYNLSDLKLRIWDFANLISETNEITEEIIKKVIDDIYLLEETTSIKHEWYLNQIVDSNLCAKCGTCAVVCPNNLIKFKEKPFIQEECLRKGNGMCQEVCPRMISGPYEVRTRLKSFEHYYYSKSKLKGQSGGVVTYLLQCLIEDGEIDGAVVIGSNKWKPVSMIITSSSELEIDTSKSKYSISSLKAIRKAGEMGLEKIAVVGLPCQVAGIRNIQYHPFIAKHEKERGRNGKPAKIPEIKYVLGLFCTEKFEYKELERKVDELNISFEDIKKCDVSGKNFIISTKTKDYPIDLSKLTPSPGCKICRDFDSELADISFGEKGSPDGYTTIIIRTNKGKIIEKYFDLHDNVNISDIEFMRKFKKKRFNNEVKRRKDNNEFNSFYYIWKHGGVGAGQKGYAYIRFRTTIGGYYNPDLLMKIAEITKKYGGIIKLTSREEIEIQEIKFSDVEELLDEFNEDNLVNGTEGPLVRSLMACPGKEHCILGLINTNEIAYEIEEKYAEKPTNYKFKIAITGCPNRCMGVSTTDFGINGVKFPKTTEKCNGCGRCQDVCKVDSIEVRGDTSITNSNTCVGCGKCIHACPIKARVSEFKGFQLFIGGKGGRETIIGHQIYVKNKKEIYDTLDAVLKVYNKLAIKPQKERLANTIKRVGDIYFFKEVEKVIGEDNV